ncbi:HAD family hydrolase [Galbitalea soli]|uniref:Hydrolase n=1 Tax=Galbitalea soli TaxID=1268042 RepID=A0A7C9PM12_9MICO|nr:HAD family hydrolase [Galbitalea soli]NEM90467.1 hydrolase [Galbitalea soli]NYJ31179.1 putative hydrolase of the HAD superfamily [Galbitalea soli]
MTLLFIFDMDDVLYRYDWRRRMAGMTDHLGLPFETLRELWWNHDGEGAAEAGRWATGEEYLAAFRARIGGDIDREDWLRIRGEAMTPDTAAIAAAARASQLGRVTLLTNNGPLVGENLATLAPALVPIFGEHLRASSHYGARKPDRVVYERVLERYAVEARDAFFADDMPINVTGAAELGITAHHFTGAAGLLAAVEAFAAARG